MQNRDLYEDASQTTASGEYNLMQFPRTQRQKVRVTILIHLNKKKRLVYANQDREDHTTLTTV